MADSGQLIGHVLGALGDRCEECLSAVRVMLEHAHDRRGVSNTAIGMALHDRKALERRLRRHGFPRLHGLKDWLRLLLVTWEWERHGTPLAEQAYAADSDPSGLYRLMHRVTGLPWQEARQQGFSYWLGRFKEEVGTRVSCGNSSRERTE